MEAFVTAGEGWLQDLGPWALLAGPAVMAAVAVLPIPAEAPAMALGMLFGPGLGAVLTWTGAMTGAWVSYELGLRLGRPAATRLAGAPALARADRLVERGGWGALLVARFVPVVAFTALNWGSGLAGVPRGRFLWTTAVGIVPGVVLFVAGGAGLPHLLRGAPPWAAPVTLVALLVLLLAVRRRGGRRRRVG